jgi:hypothetical protein
MLKLFGTVTPRVYTIMQCLRDRRICCVGQAKLNVINDGSYLYSSGAGQKAHQIVAAGMPIDVRHLLHVCPFNGCFRQNCLRKNL